jgi:excisionase family DNA binding protein
LAQEKWYSIQEAADFLGISTVTLRRYIKSRKISAYRIASRYRFKKEALEEFLEGCRLETEKDHPASGDVRGEKAKGDDRDHPSTSGTSPVQTSGQSKKDLTDAVLQDAPNQVRSLFIKAFTAGRLGRFKDAERYYRKILQQHPEDTAAYLFLGLLYQEAGKEDQALQMWREVIKVDRTSDLAEVARYHITRALRNGQ